jgi:hypothetical protein
MPSAGLPHFINCTAYLREGHCIATYLARSNRATSCNSLSTYRSWCRSAALLFELCVAIIRHTLSIATWYLHKSKKDQCIS